MAADSNAFLTVTENDLKGPCIHLNKVLAALQAQITALTNSKGGTAASGGQSAAALTNPMTAIGDMIAGGNSGALTRVPANTANARKFLREQGTGSIGAAPVFDTLVAADIPDVSGVYALLGYPSKYASFVVTGATGNISTANIQHASAVLPAGQYIIIMDLETVASGSTTVTVTFGWTSPKLGAQTLALAAVNTGYNAVVQPVRLDGVANLTVSVTKAGGGTVSYDLVISVLRIQ